VLSVDDAASSGRIAAIIGNEADMDMVAQASNGREAIQQFRQHRPDVTLMDLRLPDYERHRRDHRHPHRVSRRPPHRADDVRRRRVEIQRALEAGARGYLLKSMPPKDLVAGIRRCTPGRRASRPRSWRISPST
jgi:DNA-binding NarL/FixJ family response regulator